MELYTEKLVKGEPGNISFYSAHEAFYNMGFKIIEVDNLDGLYIQDSYVFLGGIPFIHKALGFLKKEIPSPFDYPYSLREFFGRDIQPSTVSEISNDPAKWNVFIKPRGLLKQFTGRVVRNTGDLIGTGSVEFDTPIWVSEPINFIAEWRVFVRYNQVLGVRHYKGDWRCNYDHKIIENAVEAFTDSPAAYALDFGLTNDGKFLIVEVNEGYSIGNYGLFHVDYAKLIATRWCQLTGQPDVCDF